MRVWSEVVSVTLHMCGRFRPACFGLVPVRFFARPPFPGGDDGRPLVAQTAALLASAVRKEEAQARTDLLSCDLLHLSSPPPITDVRSASSLLPDASPAQPTRAPSKSSLQLATVRILR